MTDKVGFYDEGYANKTGPFTDSASNDFSAKLLGDGMVYPSGTQMQNVIVLALVLLISLLTNLMALPVILFRRTKFGNGLFAVLILCLTISDLAVILFSVLGSLIVEASHLLWGGGHGSCQVRIQKNENLVF